jgi:hypothetical protein
MSDGMMLSLGATLATALALYVVTSLALPSKAYGAAPIRTKSRQRR